MKQVYKLYMAFLLLYAYTNIHAQDPQVIDVNKSSDATPANGGFNGYYDQAYSKYEYAVLNGVAYFAADDGIHGIELWKSDGTAGRTAMVKDINPGNATSNVHDITVSGDKVYFSADDGTHGLELWVTNGEESGTKMVKDIYKGSISSSPAYLVDGDGELYFFTNKTGLGDELWKSDGTKAGTVRIASFYTLKFNYSQIGNQLTYINGRLFFAMNAGSSFYYSGPAELWTSDGTTAGTMLLEQISSYYSPLFSFTALNGLLYFSAVDDSGRSLWVSDGTVAGTHPVNNANNIHLNEDAFNGEFFKFFIKDNKLFFSGYSGDSDGSKLCSYDPSDPSNSIEVVKDFTPGFYSYNLYNLTNVNNNIFFTVFNGADQTLWKSDGTTDGTIQVKDINPGGGNVYYYRDFKNANGTLLFTFYDEKNGVELWKSDGTEAGTIMVKDIFKGLYSSDYISGGNITYIGNNTSLFMANNGSTGLELWGTDNTQAGTKLVKDINQSATASSNPSQFTLSPDSSKLFFTATDAKYGNELRITDGTEANTELVKDIYPGFLNSNPSFIASTNDATYFFAGIKDTLRTGTSDLYTLFRLFKTDGTAQGTSLIPTPDLDNLQGNVEYTIGAGNIYYMVIYNFQTGNQELWRTDGTTDGTYAIKTDIFGGYNIDLTALGNAVYFLNYNIISGYFELWKTDGTIENIYPITPYNYSSFASLYNFYAFDNKVFFNAADNTSYVTSIWSSDGTTNHTKPSTEYITANAWLGAINGRLYFAGNDQLNPLISTELYWTNGKKSALVKDIDPAQYASSNPAYGTVVDSTLYFVAYDAYGYSLYRTKGNKVEALTTSFGNFPNNLVNANHHLYFINNNQLWQSDGTPKGTYALYSNSSQYIDLYNLTVVKDRLCILGYTQKFGQELFTLKVSPAPVAETTETAIAAAPAKIFSASLLINPFKDQLRFMVNTKDQQAVQITITDASGRTLSAEKKILSPGANIFSYNTNAFTHGIYLIRIITADGSSSLLKAVK